VRVKALSVRQPWAWAIARGRKPVENRSWTTAYRGPLIVHASMRVDLDACASPLIRDAGWHPDDPVAAIGAIVAVVDLTEICAASVADPATDCGCGIWAQPGRYHWHVAAPRVPDRPVLALGRLGLWEPADALIAELPADLTG
jgi:hypothetical protein